MQQQFKTMDDLREKIKEYQGWLARPTRQLSHPTLYRKRDVTDGNSLIKGTQKGDWFFSEDHEWVLPHDQMGLSFSSDWQHLKGIYKLKQKHNPGCAIHVYWLLEEADIPDGLGFRPDLNPGKKGHYLLTVTDRMTLDSLVKKLKVVARKMSRIKNVEKVYD
jgi:hypothetical protein